MWTKNLGNSVNHDNAVFYIAVDYSGFYVVLPLCQTFKTNDHMHVL